MSLEPLYEVFDSKTFSKCGAIYKFPGIDSATDSQGPTPIVFVSYSYWVVETHPNPLIESKRFISEKIGSYRDSIEVARKEPLQFSLSLLAPSVLMGDCAGKPHLPVQMFGLHLLVMLFF